MVRSSSSIKIVLYLLIILLSSCREQSYEYDTKFNLTRDSIGLPLLDTNWKLYKNGLDNDNREFLIYINPKVKNGWDKKSPIHYSKDIKYTSDTIIYEADTYFSGETFETIDATINISMVVKYYFTSDKEGNHKGWKYTLFSTPENNMYGLELTKEQADSVLLDWGVK